MNGFDQQEQKRLQRVCVAKPCRQAYRLSNQGCQVLISNSAANFIHSLYDDPRYEIVEVKATRAINAVGSKRGKVSEFLIHNKYQSQSMTHN
jgi:DNA adenine methylase